MKTSTLIAIFGAVLFHVTNSLGQSFHQAKPVVAPIPPPAHPAPILAPIPPPVQPALAPILAPITAPAPIRAPITTTNENQLSVSATIAASPANGKVSLEADGSLKPMGETNAATQDKSKAEPIRAPIQAPELKLEQKPTNQRKQDSEEARETFLRRQREHQTEALRYEERLRQRRLQEETEARNRQNFERAKKSENHDSGVAEPIRSRIPPP